MRFTFRPEDIDAVMAEHEDEHWVKPAIIYISNVTETGVIYKKAELVTIPSAFNFDAFVDAASMFNIEGLEDVSLDTIKDLLSVDVESGMVEVAAVRDVGGDNVEAEGMTFLATEDGAVMHVLDYNKVIGIFIHHYKVDF